MEPAGQLSESEKLELKELRISTQSREPQIKILEMEKEDVRQEISQLEKWKKGRWVGFAIALVAFIASICMFVPMINLLFDSSLGMGQYSSDAFVYSVSATAIWFAGLFVLVFALVVLFLGFKLMVEIGNSKSMRRYARNHYKKNYYNEIEEARVHENETMRELINLKKQQTDEKARISELEKRETPWNMF